MAGVKKTAPAGASPHVGYIPLTPQRVIIIRNENSNQIAPILSTALFLDRPCCRGLHLDFEKRPAHHGTELPRRK
jgi:hypothetical protein